MNESFLLKLALAVAVVGIISLYFISSQIELNDTTIEKITSGNVEDSVSVTGIIKSIKQSGQTTFITLSQTNDMDVVLFSNNVNFTQGDKVKITGKVQEYKGEKEIIADRIEKK